MKRLAMMLVISTVMAGTAVGAAQQEWQHPRSMGLPDDAFTPPDPAALRLELPGGSAAYIARDSLVPLVRMTALIGAGDADAADAAEFAAGLRAGPAAMTPGEFAGALAGMAALYEVEQTHTETRVTLEVPSEDLAPALQLFAALLREPLAGETRTADGADAVERATGESGPVMYEGSLAASVELLEAGVYGQHAYTGAAGDSTTSFRDRFVLPSNVVLAVSGDFDVDAMRNALAAAFAGWSGGAADLPQHPLPEPAPGRGLHTFDVDKLQGWVAIGHELPQVPLQDEASLMVMNYILGGGHFDTRLFRATRDRRGLTNDDSGFPEQGFRGPGLYSFRTYGRPEAVRLLIHLTLQEIERIRQEPVSEEELFVAQGALADGYSQRSAAGHGIALAVSEPLHAYSFT